MRETAAPRACRALPRLLTGGIARRRPHRIRVVAVGRPSVKRLVRTIAGWIVLVVGIIGIVTPFNPAIVVIPIGVALIGRQQPPIRWLRTRGKLLLRRAARWPGWAGRMALAARLGEKRMAKALRDRRLGAWSLAEARAAPATPAPAAASQVPPRPSVAPAPDGDAGEARGRA